MADVIKLEVKQLSSKVIFEKTCEVIINYNWDAHGKLHSWNSSLKGPEWPKYRKSAKIKIVEVASTVAGVPITTWNLYVDDKKIQCEVYRYYDNGNGRVTITAITGAG